MRCMCTPQLGRHLETNLSLAVILNELHFLKSQSNPVECNPCVFHLRLTGCHVGPRAILWPQRFPKISAGSAYLKKHNDKQ